MAILTKVCNELGCTTGTFIRAAIYDKLPDYMTTHKEGRVFQLVQIFTDMDMPAADASPAATATTDA